MTRCTNTSTKVGVSYQAEYFARTCGGVKSQVEVRGNKRDKSFTKLSIYNVRRAAKGVSGRAKMKKKKLRKHFLKLC